MPKVKLSVDTGLCIGAANCVGVSASTFRLNDENFAVIIPGEGTPFEKRMEVTSEQLSILEEAVESCPTLAISLTKE